MMTKFWTLAFILLTITSCTPQAPERNADGNALLANGQISEAIQAYQRAIVEEPDNGVYYYNLSVALARSGRTEEAELAIQQSITRGDVETISLAWYNLGNTYYDQFEIENAISAYQEALRANPNNDNARYNLELALARRSLPSPTPIEMQTNPEDQAVDTNATPTPNPSGQIAPSPTPTPPQELPPPGPSPMVSGSDDTGEESDPNQTTPIPRESGEMDVESAARLLDRVESNQERISTLRDNYNIQGTPDTEKDW